MAVNSRLPRRLRLGLLPIAALLFANPIVAIIDPLPDFLAYLLLWWGLGYVADLQSHLAEARRGFLRMAGIDALKLVGLLFLITVPVAEEQPSTQLLLTFVFSVVELIYAIPAWTHFFDGLYNLILNEGDADRYDLATPARGKRPARRRALFELLSGGTTLWIIARALLTTLPELTALSSFEHSGYVTNNDVDIYSFRGLFVLLAVAAMTVIGLRWLIRMLRLTVRLSRDDALHAALAARYTADVLPNEGLFRRRRIRLGLGVATAAALLSVDFYVEELNIIPDTLAALAMIAAILILRRDAKGYAAAIWSSGIWAGVSLWSMFTANAFHREFYPALVYKNSEAYAAYGLMCTATVIEQIAFAAALICFGVMLASLIRRCDSEAEGLWAELRGKLIGVLVLGLLSALSGVAYDLLLPSVEFIWLIDFAVALGFGVLAWKNFGDIDDVLARSIRDRGDGKIIEEGSDEHVRID